MANKNVMEQQYPGVFTAYDFIMPSYDWTITRFEAAQNRIQALQVLIVTVSFSIPGAVKVLRPDASFAAWQFVLAAIVFIGVMAVAFIGGNSGGVLVASPLVMRKKWLRFNDWEFKKNAVFFAAEHFRQNCLEIERKWKTATAMVILFTLELLLLLAWAAAPYSSLS